MFIQEALYNKIVNVLPIACVDLLVRDEREMILMLRRNDEPAKGEWWFPGGRIHYHESRKDAVARILERECSLKTELITEGKTFELIFDTESKLSHSSHGITTLYEIGVGKNNLVTVDNCSSDYAWKTAKEWLNKVEHEFLRNALKTFINGG